MDRDTSIRLKILILFMVSVGAAIFMEYQTIWAFSILMIVYYIALTLMDKCYLHDVNSQQKKKNHSVNSGGNVSECASMNPSVDSSNNMEVYR